MVDNSLAKGYNGNGPLRGTLDNPIWDPKNNNWDYGFTKIEEAGGTVFPQYEIPEKLRNHILYPDANSSQKRGISGCHNRDNFLDTGVIVVSQKFHSTMDGIAQLEYYMPKLDRAGNPIPGEHKGKRLLRKTVYDPNIISDDEYLSIGMRLDNTMASKYPNCSLKGEYMVLDRGIFWQCYYRDGKLTTFFPYIPNY